MFYYKDVVVFSGVNCKEVTSKLNVFPIHLFSLSPVSVFALLYYN
jgi:hypothetical protein